MNLLKRLLLPHPHNNHRAKIRHTSGLAWLSLLSLMIPFWLNTMAAATPQILGYASAIPAQQLIELTNQERAKQGLNPLSFESQLTASAQAKAQDMLAHNYWAHVSPSGDQPWVFFTRAGYAYMYAGENLARDFMDPGSIVAAWMASPTHRDNILNPQFQEIGIAVVDGTLDGSETTLIVQHFGRPRTGTPEIQAANTTTNPPQTPTATPSPTPTPEIEEIIPLIESEEDDTATIAAIAQPDIPATQTNIPQSGNSDTSFAAFSPLQISKSWNLAIVGLLIFVLLLESVIVWWKRIPRISGRPVAHLLLLFMLMATILYTQSGLIK